MSTSISSESEISRLISAAIVSEDFRVLLLKHPQAALTAGFQGESFNLTPQQLAQVLSIRGASLSDFAQQFLPDSSSVSA